MLQKLSGETTNMNKNLISSFSNAFKGIMKLFLTERNAQIHLSALIIVVILGIYFQLNTIEWCLIIISSGMVIGAEGFNTAIENTVDLISPEIQEKAGNAKDIAAGAVLLAAIAAGIVGTLIFGPKILQLF